jgi:hypothetical protein
MSTIPQIAENIRNVLGQTARRAGETTGFIERERKFDGATFAQTLVFGWLGNGAATLDEMSQMASVLGVDISRQGLDKRFTPEAAALMYEVLKAAVAQTVSAVPAKFEILARFKGVYIVDSSIVQLPEALLGVWQGSGGGRTGQQNAGVKLSLRWNWQTGELHGPDLDDARSHDQSASVARMKAAAGSLHIADLGYFNLGHFQQIEEQGAYWLSRYKARTSVLTTRGRQLDLPTFLEAHPANQIELSVRLGAQQAVSCRLVAQRLPDALAAERREHLQKDARREGYQLSRARWILAGWMVLLTNVPSDWLSFDQLFVVYRVRWQIELLFKLWKSEGLLDEWRTTNPWRILCEVYAKLIALLIQHWLLITACWHRPERSLFQACRVIQRFAWTLAFTLRFDHLFELFLLVIHHCLSSGSCISKQQIRPPTFQLLLAA